MVKRIRKRGIKASREKLEIAMLNANIKTQASLAEKIAQSEKLSIPPKDTINRVFREESVSPKTIVRIAKILLVEPHTLYLPKSAEVKTDAQHSTLYQKVNKPLLGKFSLVLNCKTPELTQFTGCINHLIKDRVKTVIINPSLVPDQYMTIDIARQYQTDGVLSIRSQKIDRYQALQVFIFFQNSEKLIWTHSITSLELKQRPEQIAEKLIPTINHVLGLETTSKNLPTFESIESQEKYLKARQLLDDHHSEVSLKKAQSLLLSALKLSPNFALAQAALAESYICECWRSDTKALLEDAQIACNRALKISPEDPYINTTLSHLFRVTGRIPEAIKLCKDILKKHKDNIDAISGLANVYIEANDQATTEIPDAGKQALYYAEKAVEVEPDYWRHHNDLGNNRYLTNRPLEALAAYEISAQLNPKEITYINLGAMSLCQNHLSKARGFFNKAHELSPESYLGYENLGYIYYFTGDYNKSIEYIERALESFPDKKNISIHQIWGALADSHRLAGNLNKAVETYAIAINIIERDKLQGYSNLTYKVCHYFYYYFISNLQPEQYPANYLQEIERQLPDLINQDLSSGVYAKLAYLLFLQGNYIHSKQALEKATAICPVFYQHPDLKPILKTLGLSSPISNELEFA